MIWRVPISIVLWLLRLAVFLLFAIPGIPIVYLLARFGCYELRHSPKFDRTVLQWRPLWLWWVYSNCEDGVDGLRGGDSAQQWWADRTAGWSIARRIFVWAAIRNPVDSLRFVPVLNPKIDPSRVRYVGMDHEPAKGEGGWYFAWQGIYSCIRYERWGWRFWLGWKLKPDDVKGLQPADPRAIRCDFAAQLKRVSK